MYINDPLNVNVFLMFFVFIRACMCVCVLYIKLASQHFCRLWCNAFVVFLAFALNLALVEQIVQSKLDRHHLVKAIKIAG